MPTKICPNCNQRYVVANNTDDFIHLCNSGNEALDKEDVPRIGNWEDDSGTGTIGPQEVLMQGSHNELFGTKAEIDGQRKQAISRRGNRVATHRVRDRDEFINISKEGLD